MSNLTIESRSRNISMQFPGSIEYPPSYAEKCRTLLHHSHELDEILRSDEIKDKLHEESVLIFGPSRTGKSVLFARLKSSRTAEEFMNRVYEICDLDDDRPIQFDDEVRCMVGSGDSSVTTTPNFETDRGRLMIDLAGFLDSDLNRRSPVYLLNHRLFSKLSQTKIMVVLNASIFVSLNQTIENYKDEFMKMFTEAKFDVGLDGCIFAITKVDEAWKSILMKAKRRKESRGDYDEAVVKSAISDLLLHFADAMIGRNPDVAKFARRMRRSFILLNYEHDDGKVCREKIYGALDQDAKSISSRSFQIGLNEINDDLGEDVRTMIRRYGEFVTSVREESQANYTNARQSIRLDEYKIGIDSIREDSKEVTRLQQLISSKNTSISILSDDLQRERSNIEDYRAELKEAKMKFDTFVGKIEQNPYLHTLVLSSNERAGMMRRTTHKVNASVQLMEGVVGSPIVMIYKKTVYHEVGQEIKKMLRPGSLRELQIPTLLNQGNPSSEFKEGNGSWDLREFNGIVTIEAEYSQPFFIVLGYDLILGQSLYRDILIDALRETVNKCEARVLTCESRIEDLMFKIDQGQTEVTGTLQEIEMVSMRTDEKARAIISGLQRDRGEVKASRSFLVNGKSSIEGCIGSENFQLTEGMCQFFHESSINVDEIKGDTGLRGGFQSCVDSLTVWITKMDRSIAKLDELMVNLKASVDEYPTDLSTVVPDGVSVMSQNEEQEI